MSRRSLSSLLPAANRLRSAVSFRSVARFATAASPADQFYYNLREEKGREVEKALATVTAKLDPQCVTEVIGRCLPSQTQLGLRFFIWAGLQSGYRHTSHTYERACKSLKINRNPKIIRDVIEAYRAESCLVTVKTFKVVLNLCREAKLASEAFWVLRRTPEFGLRADTGMYNVVIKLFCMKGDMDNAENLMEEMSSDGLYPDMITCMEMVKGFCKAGRSDDAFRLFKVVKQQGCVPNTALYSCLLDGFCRNGDMDRTMELLEEMERSGGEVSPNVVTYTSVIQRFCEKGQIVEALEVLDRMEAHGCFPNHVTFSTLAERLCEEGRIEEVNKLIERVVGSGGVSYGKCYSSFVVALKRFGVFEEAEKVFRKMIASELAPDGLACSIMIKEFILMDRVLEGYRLCDEIEKMGCLPTLDSDICSLLLAGLCHQGHLVEAVKLAKLMLKNGLRLLPPYDGFVAITLTRSGNEKLVNDLTQT